MITRASLARVSCITPNVLRIGHLPYPQDLRQKAADNVREVHYLYALLMLLRNGHAGC